MKYTSPAPRKNRTYCFAHQNGCLGRWELFIAHHDESNREWVRENGSVKTFSTEAETLEYAKTKLRRRNVYYSAL